MADTIRFFDLQTDEHIIVFMRRHMATNGRWILTSLGIALLPPLFALLQQALGFSFLTIGVALLPVLLAFWYLLLLAFVWEHFLSWYFNIYLVTNHRLVDIDVHGFLQRSVAETPVAHIQDVQFSSKGLWPTLFDYGDLFVQTAGVSPEFDFHAVAHPAQVHDLITDQLRKAAHHAGSPHHI